MAGPRGQPTNVSNEGPTREGRRVLALEREAVGLVDRMPELLMEADRIASNSRARNSWPPTGGPR